MADTLRTEAELLQIFGEGQPPASISEQDMRDLIISLRRNQGHGWVFHVDNARFLEVNALAVSASTRTKLLNDGEHAISQVGQVNDMGEIWDVVNNWIKPELSSAYEVRITFNCKTTTGGTGNYLELDMDIGAGGIGSGPVVFKEIRALVKGANLDHNFVFGFPIFAEEPFPTNGGSFFITTNVDLNVWNFRLYIQRSYKAQ